MGFADGVKCLKARRTKKSASKIAEEACCMIPKRAMSLKLLQLDHEYQISLSGHSKVEGPGHGFGSLPFFFSFLSQKASTTVSAQSLHVDFLGKINSILFKLLPKRTPSFEFGTVSAPNRKFDS